MRYLMQTISIIGAVACVALLTDTITLKTVPITAAAYTLLEGL